MGSMSLSEAGKIMNAEALKHQASRLLADAVAVALDTQNSITKLTAHLKTLTDQVAQAQTVLKDRKANLHKVNEQASADAQAAKDQLTAALSKQRQEDDKERKTVLDKIADARKVYAEELAAHEQKVATLTAQEKQLSDAVRKHQAALDAFKQTMTRL